jgi:nucleoside 2-deoxyribosyltransferase
MFYVNSSEGQGVNRLTVYLAGAIRPENNYDISWRERASSSIYDAIREEDVSVISPMSYKSFVDGEWLMFDQFPFTSQSILQQDMMSISLSDIILMNLLPINEHPMIGTFSEFGIALAQRKPIIVVATDEKLINHPFIAAGAHRILPTVDDAIDYTIGLIGVQLGV